MKSQSFTAGTIGFATGVVAAFFYARKVKRIPNTRMTPDELSSLKSTGGAGSSGEAGIEEITVFGNPSAPDHYVQLLKVPANTKVAAHHHAGNRVGTVLSGTWHFGYGPKYDEQGLRTLPTGSMYTEPDGVAHFARTGDSAVVVQLSGFGPTNTVYVNPADDPTKKH